MQPPAARAGRLGRRLSNPIASSHGSSTSGSSDGNRRRRSSSGGGQQQLVSTAAVAGVSGVSPASLPLAETRAVLSGSLFRCSPVFSSSSDTVFCGCSTSVLGVSVETGEQLLRLAGHSKDVTAMLFLPPGVYGDAASCSAGAECLLTSSMDGTLRLWDVSPNLMSLEGDEQRCLRVFVVGKPVYHLFLGRQDASGKALDVVVVTKEGISDLHGLAEGAGGGGGSGGGGSDGGAPTPNGRAQGTDMDTDDDEDDDEDLTSEEDDDSSDDDDGDDDDDVDAREAAAGGSAAFRRRGHGAGVAETEAAQGKSKGKEGSGRREGGSRETGSGSGSGAAGVGRGRKVGGAAGKAFEPRSDWQAVRYGLVEGAAQAIILVTRQNFRWIGITAPSSPITTTAGGGVGSKKRRGTCPVLLSADGRVVTAVDVGTGDRAALVTAIAPVRTLAIGVDGEMLVTGHQDGSMSQWHDLPDRLGAAFGVSGFGMSGAGGEGPPSTDMHWHAHAVQCLAVAPDGVQLFSGGEEAVLVQWNLTKGTRAFLPRLGAPLQGLAVSPSQEHAVATTRDNAVTLVGLAGWDVMWQMRGLALSRRFPPKLGSLGDGALGARLAVKLTIGPKHGLVACNGRAGHVQFYNLATNCLEASVEVVRFNRDTSAKGGQAAQLAKLGGKDDAAATTAAAAAALGPVVEHVAFSSDGKRMVAVASRVLRHAFAAPSLSFWRHERGSDPYESFRGYTGSYTGASNARRGSARRGGGSGTAGHWAADTNVDSPHGPGNTVAALEYHPREDVVVTAGKEDGAFNLWGLRRTESTLESLAAAHGRGGKSKEEGDEGGAPAMHWACSLSVRYKEGLVATEVSFSSDGSVLAVAYSPFDGGGGGGQGYDSRGAANGKGQQGVITLWSLETVTLLSTLLPPRPRDLRFSMSRRHLARQFSPQASRPPSEVTFLGFIPGSGRILAAGGGYAAAWDMLSPAATPLWEYRARIIAAATADSASVSSTGKAGISVKGKAIGDLVLCVDAASLGGAQSLRERGSVVLLLNSSNPTPLHVWRLPGDRPTSLKLLFDCGDGGSPSPEGVLCLTRRGELLLLSTAEPPVEGAEKALGPRQQQQQQSAVGIGVVRITRGASAPAQHLSGASKRVLLAADLAGSDPALLYSGGGKRLRVHSAAAADDDKGAGEWDAGHVGGREAVLRSAQRATDVLDPSTLNLASVPEMYDAFMSTLIKPAPPPQQQQQQQKQQPHEVGGGAPLAAFDPALGVVGGIAGGVMGSKARKGKRGGDKFLVSPRSVLDDGLLSVLSEQLKA